jgi:hypothetical protein
MRWIAIPVLSLAMAAGVQGGWAQATSIKIVSPDAPSKARSAAKSVKGPATTKAAAAPAALLPESFSGWVADAASKRLTDALQADAANAEALKEYEFTDGATAGYKRNGETLSLRALRFHDASGAYGAYSYYRQNGWPKEEIGAGATSNHNRVLFWKGNVVVDANFSRIGPMSGSELRDLASQLPVAEGNKAMAPPILADLPQASLDGQTTHYAVGSASYSGSGGVLPVELVGFNMGAETATANYKLRSGEATLTIIDYPTPQLAATMETRIRAYINAGKVASKSVQPAWTKALADSDQASLEVRRSGPLVALVSGDAIPDESHKLIGTVHFEADYTSVPQQSESEVAKTGRLLMGLAALVIIGASAAILLGFFLGGGRALYRMARGKPASSIYDEEFIRLNLRD